MITLLTTLAYAAGVHTGIPVRGVPGLGDPTFLTPETGWTAPVGGGFVRVFVGATETEAQRWFADAETSLTVAPASASGPWDEGFGDGVGLLAFREGNIGVFVRTPTEARGVAERLASAIVSPASPPAMVKVTSTSTGWTITAPGAQQLLADDHFVSATSGVSAPLPAAPREVVAWDAYGRVTRWATPRP